MAIFLTLAGFAFKVSAVPFHFWTPDTYEGAPTPVTAFLSVASKAGGFVALLSIVTFGFFQSQDSWEPVLWMLAAASMIFGNLVACARPTSCACSRTRRSRRAGSSSCRSRSPVTVKPRRSSFEAVLIYILIYGAMNLGGSRW